MTRSARVVVIGAGFGGLAAARKLVDRGFQVTLIDRRSYHLFTPLLYQVATGSLSPGEVAVPIRSIFRGRDNVRCLLGEVTHINPEGRCVRVDEKTEVEYDYLVFAVGAQSHYFGREDEWGSRVHTLDDLRSAGKLRDSFLLCCEEAEKEVDPERRSQLLTVAIIGAGPSGVELAGALADLAKRTLAAEYQTIEPQDVKIVLYEALDRVLPTFDERLSAQAEQHLRELGVEVRVGESVSSVKSGLLVTSKEQRRVGMNCWGSGVRPADAAALLDVPKEKGRIVVDQYCSVREHPELFVIGDAAHFQTREGTPLPGLAPVALQQGRHVADTILNEARGRARRPFVYRDKGMMATVGRFRAVVQSKRMRLHGGFAWLGWLGLHVAYLMGFRRRLLVLLEWAWAYIGAERGNRLIETEARALHQQR